ncbi:hypothetical protein BGX31_003333 [Mortierella sp. GBA43]|nr:hypothetical protein BGX31_003333 [Mortierella sp. GBA43]
MDDEVIYEFICDEETTSRTVNTFEKTVYQCMYQFKYKKSHTSATDQDLLQFKITTPRPRSLSAPVPSSHRTRSKTQLPKVNRSVVKTEPGHSPVRDQQMLPSNAQRLEEFHGELRKWDGKVSDFISHWPDSTDSTCWILQEQLPDGSDSYWLSIVRNNNTRQVVNQFGDSMNPILNPIGRTFTWDDLDDNSGKGYTWQYSFKDEDNWGRFSNRFAHCMFKVKKQNEAGSSRFPQPSKAESSQEYYDAEGSEESSNDNDEEHLEANEDPDGDHDMNQFVEPHENARNSHLAVGYKDRSFVVRGSKIGVFSHNERDGLDFQTTIKNISNSRNKTLKPSKAILHEEDRTMVVMDPTEPHTAYKMDLEYGRIVEEWDISGTSDVVDLVSSSKYAQRTDERTMIGIARNSIFRIDPRQPRNKIVQAENKEYAIGTQFTCGATTDHGYLAVAGAKGDIKLFNALGKIAKTALPAQVGPIIGLDVSANGRYVLATCRQSIQVIDVLNSTNGELGFNISFPAKSKPIPILLELKPEHKSAMKTPINFTPARFNMGINEEEKTIVTSTGPYVITWNFRRVKLGHKDYNIMEYSDTVVADNFKYGQDRSIIVTLPHDGT